MDGLHSIYIADDTFMIEFQLLQDNEGLSEAEALDEVFDVGWWMNHLPLAGVFIDGIEQTDWYYVKNAGYFFAFFFLGDTTLTPFLEMDTAFFPIRINPDIFMLSLDCHAVKHGYYPI